MDTVFIALDATEKEPVKIKKDRETGKSKGYGFCDAKTTKQLLDGYEFKGRSL